MFTSRSIEKTWAIKYNNKSVRAVLWNDKIGKEIQNGFTQLKAPEVMLRRIEDMGLFNKAHHQNIPTSISGDRNPHKYGKKTYGNRGAFVSFAINEDVYSSMRSFMHL